MGLKLYNGMLFVKIKQEMIFYNVTVTISSAFHMISIIISVTPFNFLFNNVLPCF